MAAQYTLVIGNKNLSSWSLRPYLALRATKAPFEEVIVRLDQPETRASITKHSPAGKVPVLKIMEGEMLVTIWDSLAICETLAERHPEAGLWPEDWATRARARSYAAEMHSGFPDVRQMLPMAFARKLAMPERTEALDAQLARLTTAWSEALERHPGGFLFGRFSIADCMYGPVVSRFVTYGTELPPPVKAYCDRMMALPAMQDWMAAAKAEVDRGWQ
jgi:glutathione S-transferase